MKRVAAETVAVLERAVRNPAILVEVARKARARMTAERHRARLIQATPYVRAPLAGLAAVLGVPPATVTEALAGEGFHAILRELDAYVIPSQGRRMGGPAFLEACYAITRLLRPEIVLETGVAHGYSSAVILQALHENGRGRLYSVDLPRFRPGIAPYTGRAVPDRLRAGRWDLRLGADRQVLPGLLQEIGAVDFLFYDSDTSYAGMRHTWELVWPFLRPGGVMASNVVHANDAFLEFAQRHALEPVIIPQPKRQGAYVRPRQPGERIYYMGLVRKA
jgi:predicted O-methyltransferase YrrM